MSKENVDLVRAGYDALNRRDLSGLIELVGPQVELHSVISPLEGGRAFRGTEGFREYVALISAALVDVTWEVERITDIDDEQVIAYVHMRGQGTTSGAEIDHRSFAVFKLHAGKVLRIDSYTDEELALAAVRRGSRQRFRRLPGA
jgi:ketosteroid isomerase-like protein